ncbi:MAG TPA: histidine kinase [Nitrolancea sp.]|nr:histidine kinase [Nitrolancea sp.]
MVNIPLDGQSNAAFTATSTRRNVVWRTLALGLWGLTLLQLVAGLVLVGLNRLSLRLVVSDMVLSVALAALTFSTVGLLIIRRHPRHLVGWLFLLTGARNGLFAWTGEYARYTLVTHPGALIGGEQAFWINSWLWIPVEGLAVLLLPLLFPDGRLLSPRWRAFVALTIGGLLLLSISTAFGPNTDSFLPHIENPYLLQNLTRELEIIGAVGIILLLGALCGSVAAPFVRFRNAHGLERQQLKWFAFGATILILGFVISVTAFLSGVIEDGIFSGILLAVALPCVPLACGIAILRHGLYDIDHIINRSLVYGALTAAIVSIYVLVVGYLGSVFRTHGEHHLLISLIATGAVAIIFQPLRDWLQQGVNRMMFGERDAPYRVLSRLNERLESTIAPYEVMSSIVETVREALRLPYAAIALPRDSDSLIAFESGRPVPVTLRLPLTYRGETTGELLLAPRSPSDAWSPADRRLLDDLARHAGLAMQGVRALSDLQNSRERLVLAREEERRRLRRDLHDDLAPKLAGLGLAAATVGELIQTNPERAAEINAQLEQAIRGTVADIRRLVYDLRPPALDEFGLVDAIRDRAAHYSLHGTSAGETATVFRVEVHEPLPPLPAAIEVAALRVSQEAIMNVVRHARARECIVRLTCPAGSRLVLEVVDDGVGLSPERLPGIGLRSMKERASELGGDCVAESEAGQGTTVRAWFPLNHDQTPVDL